MASGESCDKAITKIQAARETQQASDKVHCSGEVHTQEQNASDLVGTVPESGLAAECC